MEEVDLALALGAMVEAFGREEDASAVAARLWQEMSSQSDRLRPTKTKRLTLIFAELEGLGDETREPVWWEASQRERDHLCWPLGRASCYHSRRTSRSVLRHIRRCCKNSR